MYSTVIRETSPGVTSDSIFSKSVENFEKHQNKNFLEFHLVYNILKFFSGTKNEKITYS